MEPIYYVTYDANGALDGAFYQVPPGEHADCMIEVPKPVYDAWVQYRANEARDGVELLPPAPAPMPGEADYVAAILSMLDAKAQERRYFGILSASTYVNSTNNTFKTEATALLAWRDEVWLAAYQKFDAVEAGQMSQPTIPELLAMLPTFTWPA